MVLLVAIFLLQTVLHNSAQDAGSAGICNSPLGLSTGILEDALITSGTSEDSTPSSGRLGNTESAWCFTNNTIATQTAVLTVNLSRKRFVSGFASQGPPEKLHPKSYNHVIGFSAAYSLNSKDWSDFNGGTFFFDNDKNDTSDIISYHLSNLIVFTQYVKINVTMQVSGSSNICLRFEVYGCDTDVQPFTGMQATTTTKGKIEVIWNIPTADTSLEVDLTTRGPFLPSGYVVGYKPAESQTFLSAGTSEMSLSLEDVRLGATYIVQLKCLFQDISVNCGSAQIQAYPPCPEEWTGGNEYHCFLYLSDVATFTEAKSTCLQMDVKKSLGKLSYLVDDTERNFLATKILPEDITQLWLIGEECESKDDCCRILMKEGGIFREAECADKALSSAVCLKDHKGEGARMRISVVEALENGKSVNVKWLYEGVGWKTDKLQAKLWTGNSGEENPTMLTFSTLSDAFTIQNLEPGTMFSLLLRPAPNIRTEELVYKFIIIDYVEEDGGYGALLTPISMSVYVIWSGTLRVTWETARTFSVTGTVKKSKKYFVSHAKLATGDERKQVMVESSNELLLTPLEMKVTYLFDLECFFVGAFYPCGSASVATDPPDSVNRDVSGIFTVYEVFGDSMKMWIKAEEDCQQRSGHLTNVLNPEEGRMLMKILPSKDAKVWTGAKLTRDGTSYWSDGNKITYLPMAKNSGVIASKESCCRALNEAGKLRLAGGKCSDYLPYICKYTFQDMLTPPNSLSAAWQAWNGFEVNWIGPEEGWLPTHYNVEVCRKEGNGKCIIDIGIQNLKSVTEGLEEFTEYEVTVSGVLQPVNISSLSKTTIYTYPKSAVRVGISISGDMVLETPMLIAMGREDASVLAKVSQLGETVVQASGDVRKIELTGLTPEEKYDVVVQEQGNEWKHQFSMNAIPSCLNSDVQDGAYCYKIIQEEKSFEESNAYCRTTLPSEDVLSMALWSPDSLDNLKNLVDKFELKSSFWMNKPASNNLVDEDEDCPVKVGDVDCCYYSASKDKVECTRCCDKELVFICAYEMKVNLGQVTNLLPAFIGNNSIQIRWSHPQDISWKIKRYEIQWRSVETPNEPTKTVVVDDSTEISIEGLDIGSEYEVNVTPSGSLQMKGESLKILISTLDPRAPLIIKVTADGVTHISSQILEEKGRGDEEVDVAVLRVDPVTSEKKTVTLVRGKARGIEVTELELGGEYYVEMSPAESGKKSFNYSTTFKAYPSCAENQIQDGMVCIWAAEQSMNQREAAQVCLSANGKLLDFNTQKVLTPEVKARLASYIKQRFWMDLSNAKSSALVDDNGECSANKDPDIMCCTFELSSNGELDDLKCTCCVEPRLFACMSQANVQLGSIGDITVEERTSTSVTVGWTMASGTSWKQPSFLVMWETASEREKREAVEKEIVVGEPRVTIDDLKSATDYRITVAPYTDATKAGGSSNDITVRTKDDDIVVAGIGAPGCTVVILKITCCIAVILGTIFTVFVYIATKMLYLDCLAQIFCELGLLGAYLSVLVSSAQSYSTDDECVNANPNLCVAVAALIQFFFQAVFLFLTLESLIMASVLKDYLPMCWSSLSPLSLTIIGFGIPAVMNIVLAATASDEYSDGNDNCWLDLQGKAMLPSIVPVIIFSVFNLFVLFSIFDADQPKGNLPPHQFNRGKIFLKTRWACFIILAVTIVAYSTGMVGANNRDSTLNYVFVVFSLTLSILIPLLRIKWDDEVKEQLKRGLFANIRDDIGVIRVTPAPTSYDPHPLLQMDEFNTTKYKQKQLASLATKRSDILMDPDAVWHR